MTSYAHFLAANRRRPSKYYPEERKLWNWFKHNKKVYNRGLLPDDRVPAFKTLLDTADMLRRRNQYAYSNGAKVGERIRE